MEDASTGARASRDDEYDPSRETPLGRLMHLYRAATRRMEPGDEVPEVPPELREWSQNTAVALLAGITFGGGRAFIASRQEGPPKPQRQGLSKGQEARLIAEDNTMRIIRFSKQAIKGGLQFGSLAGLFYAAQALSAVANGERSIQDVAIAGSVTGAVFGAFMPGPAGLRLRSSVLGGVLGAAFGYPVGWAQQKVEANLEGTGRGRSARPNVRKKPSPRYPTLEGDPTEAVIRQMESSIKR